MNIDISKLRLEIYNLANHGLNEALAKEVFKMKKTDEAKNVKDINTGNVMGKSKWRSADDIPIMLPNFSETMFVGVLMLEDLNAEVDIKRKNGGHYQIVFTNGSGTKIKGESFPQTVARGVLFEKRYKEAKGIKPNIKGAK